MNTLFLFDVDGVLCDRGRKIDSEFKAWFLTWIEHKQFFFLTGSGREKTIEQLGYDLVSKTRISYHCMANSIWIDDKEVSINQFILKPEELAFIENYVRNNRFPKKTGNHIDIRNGSINFSVVGRNATEDDRKLYISFDNMHQDRKNFIRRFTQKFPRFEAYYGGDVSVDICLQDCNKQQVLTLLMPHDKLYFFGDRCYPGGIDYPLAKNFQQRKIEEFKDISNIQRYQWEYFQIDDGYKQTWEILKLL